jgi:hypothetical protein
MLRLLPPITLNGPEAPMLEFQTRTLPILLTQPILFTLVLKQFTCNTTAPKMVTMLPVFLELRFPSSV